MYRYRITKYNPMHRNEEGLYILKEDWTSISEIGKKFDGIELTVKQYKKTENAYVDSIRLIMQYIGIKYMLIKNIEPWSTEHFNKSINKYSACYNNELIELRKKIKNESKLDIEKTTNFCRLCLREEIWARIVYPRRLKIYFGHDYYMYIHSSVSLEKIIPQIEALGLFVDPGIGYSCVYEK